jgi:hypothetical protein
VGVGEGNRAPDLRFTSFRTATGRGTCALLVVAVAVHLRPPSSGALAALLAATRPRRISSSGHGCPYRFKLDQRRWPVSSGRRRTASNCNPNCNPARWPLRPELAAPLGS